METQPYRYSAQERMTRAQLDVMRVRFAPDWTLFEVAKAVSGMGGRLVNDGKGGLVVVRDSK